MASNIDSETIKKERARRLKKVTLLDVARASFVSATTVSLVLHNKGVIPEETRKKVREASHKLGYRNANDSDMKRMIGFIGILIDTMENPYFTEMVEPLETVLNREGYASIVLITYGDKKRQDHLLESLNRLNLSGLVIIPAPGTDENSLAMIESIGIPFTLGIRHLGFGEFDYVGPNYFSGMQQATRHLIELGHRAIAFVGGEQRNTAYIERLSSFTSLMKIESIPIVPEWVVTGPPVFSTGRDAARSLATEKPHPTAIIAYNDIVACGVIRGLQDQGYIAGQDIAVIGFDGIREAANNVIPITTVSTPPDRIGYELAHLLLKRIKEPGAMPVNIMPPPKLIVRQSSQMKNSEVLETS